MNQEFNLTELVAVVADNTGQLKSDVNAVLVNAFKELAEQVATNPQKRVEINGLGVLKLKKVKERAGVAPNGENYTTPEHYRVKFVPSALFLRNANEVITDLGVM